MCMPGTLSWSMLKAIKAVGARRKNAMQGAGSEAEVTHLGFSAVAFRRKLIAWYTEHARVLPWRGVDDPYATWLSEIMLQQTRVATVIDRYKSFLLRFPTISDLAAAEEDDVLALWSGLGYYRRARMLHRGAQFVVREMGGELPSTSVELRTLPGVGEYTAAAIASIAFGESIAVLDGNVERVLLRLTGQSEKRSSRTRARLVETAQMLVPPTPPGHAAKKRLHTAVAKSRNVAGDHNQAMMELGATICVPRAPLCLQCPVLEMCSTRGEHVTVGRAKMQSQTVAYLLALRKRGVETEVLLQRRAKDASLMPGMMELPALALEATEGREPALRLRHAITNTNYYVQIFTESVEAKVGVDEPTLLDQIPTAEHDLMWVTSTKLAQQPLTGLARKTLQRLHVMTVPPLRVGSYQG